MYGGPPSPSPQIAITPEDTRELVSLVRSLTGITLSERKGEFLTARLGKRLVANGIADYSSYRKFLRGDATERTAFAEALTTHTTSFFREKTQYDWLLNEGFPELEKNGHARQRELVFWSAACSTGQEGYTTLMVAELARARGNRSPNARLIGTDISRPVLRTAAQAVYSQEQIEGIPEDLRRQFLLSSKSGTVRHRIVPELRAKSTWRQANLSDGAGLDGISADVVFLRNVLIYFDEQIRTLVIGNILRRLRPGGFLLTGHTEASLVRSDMLSLIRPSIYRKV